MNTAATLKKFGLEKAFNYLYKDPEKNMRKMLNWAEKFAGSMYPSQLAQVRAAVENPDHPFYPFIRHLIRDVDREVFKTVAVNFFIHENMIGWPKQEEMRQHYRCNIPWAILMDPTSACNPRCAGCWAAEYGPSLNLTLDEMDDIILQGKALGVYLYIYTGGEPLVRKEDILRLCQKHDDCVFLCFTNGTLIDESFADGMLRVKNFVPAISLEGMEAATDERRGKGVFAQVMQAMDLLRKKKLVYGISSCYTSANYDSVTSEAYYDMLIEKGASFVWYFHYMPVGNDALPALLPTPGQREEVYLRIRDYRSRKPLFAIDFQNDAEFVGGCIAGGRRYFHINAHGDMDPCVFIHYSDANIRSKTILEALRSPLFQAYHDGQPFCDNMFRPCPMLENPDALRRMVQATGAKYTDLNSPESADHLCAKCDPYAHNWQGKAEELWEERRRQRQAARPDA